MSTVAQEIWLGGIKGFQLGIKGFQLGIKGFQLGIKGFQLGIQGFQLGIHNLISFCATTPLKRLFLTL